MLITVARPCGSRRVGLSFLSRGKMMRPRWWAGWRENAIQQSEEMPRVRACDEEERADRQGRPAVEMPGLPVELDDAAAAAQAGADAGGVPVLAAGAVIPKGGGPRGRRPRPAQTNRMVLAHPPAHRPAGRQAPHGHGGRHVHGPRLVPDHRHRRANRRGAGPAVVRARVQGRIPGPVLPASRAGRAHHRRAARRGGGVHAGVAGNEDPALPGARAAQREDGPDVQARAPGRPRARGCPTGSPRSGRPGGPSGGARPSTHGTNGGRTSSPNAPTRATTRPTPRRRGTGGGGRTRSCDAATGGWRGCSARAGCSPISSRNCGL